MALTDQVPVVLECPDCGLSETVEYTEEQATAGEGSTPCIRCGKLIKPRPVTSDADS